jgi:molybdopterin molybdotransferase
MPLFGRKKNDEALRHVPEVAVLPEPPAPGPDGLRTLAQHRDYVLGCVEELMPFGQHVLDALGLSLCEDVVSGIDLPRFDNSAMDGYAVRAADVQYAT